MNFPRKEKTAAEEIVYVAFSSDVQGETADGGVRGKAQKAFEGVK